MRTVSTQEFMDLPNHPCYRATGVLWVRYFKLPEVVDNTVASIAYDGVIYKLDGHARAHGQGG